jgi:hypothetical protein
MLPVLWLLSGCGPTSIEKKFIKEGEEVGQAVGEVLRQRHPEARIMVMTRPELKHSPLSASELSLLHGIEKALGGAVQQEELSPRSEQLEEIDAQAKRGGVSLSDLDAYRTSRLESLSTWYDAKNLQAFLKKQQGRADVVLSMVGLPDNMEPEEFPDDPELPALAALNVTVADAIRFLEQGSGLFYQVVRPSGELPAEPGLEIKEVGEHALLLYPSATKF